MKNENKLFGIASDVLYILSSIIIPVGNKHINKIGNLAMIKIGKDCRIIRSI
jgi:hypothetical protein